MVSETTMAFTTRTRIWMNRGLGVVGLKINTTRPERAEESRLRALAARGHWLTPRFAPGLQIDDGRCLRFLGEVCLPYREQYGTWSRSEKESKNGFYLNNDWFGGVDAEMLYSIVRFYRPSMVVEVGSGFSTRLVPGVLIYVDDIFTPFDYPREWVVDNGWNFNEQYIVQALLFGSSALEILWPAYYIWRCHQRALRDVIPSDTGPLGLSSLWLRRLA